MKAEIVEVLSQGARSKVELAAFFGSHAMPMVMESMERLMEWGLVAVQGRQIHEGHNVFHWEYEYFLQVGVAA